MPRSDDWNQHWNAYAEAAHINPASAYRRQLVYKLLDLAASPRPVRVLELGCGQGDLAQELAEACADAEYLGLDRSEAGVDISQSKVPQANFLVRDLEQPLNLPSQYEGWATHVVCSELLEHVDDPAAVLRNVRPYLSRQGIVVITVPGGPRSAFDLHIGHRRHFTVSSLSQVVRDAGLSPREVYGAGFPFFNLYRLAVVASGRRLIDKAQQPGFAARPLSRLAGRVFSSLFRANVERGPHGWQIVGVAVRP